MVKLNLILMHWSNQFVHRHMCRKISDHFDGETNDTVKRGQTVSEDAHQCEWKDIILFVLFGLSVWFEISKKAKLCC
jgi:hypothetical protein